MPSIKEKQEKSKYLTALLQNNRIFIVSCFILALVSAVGASKLVKILRARPEVIIRENAFETNLSGKQGGFVASKTGKTYYFPWCGTAKRIKDINLVWFEDRAQAEQKGYRPAGNCRGLK